MAPIFHRFSWITVVLSCGVLSGCGYALRGNTRPFFERKEIRTLYVPPVKNNSYKAGIELTVYNALRKRIAQGGYVRITESPKDADASFEAVVNSARYVPAGVTSADQLPPVKTAPSNVQIASSYSVTLEVGFTLKDRKNASLWSGAYSRSKSFTAATYVGALGTTSGLINESEFERALGDLSISIVTDAEESINTIF